MKPAMKLLLQLALADALLPPSDTAARAACGLEGLLVHEQAKRAKTARDDAAEILAKFDKLSVKGLKSLAANMDMFLLLELLAQSNDKTASAAAKAVSDLQRDRAKKPRKGKLVKAAFVAAMRLQRKAGKTLGDFIDAAVNDSIEGACLRDARAKGVTRYVASLETDDDGESVSPKTLQSWWREAAS